MDLFKSTSSSSAEISLEFPGGQKATSTNINLRGTLNLRGTMRSEKDGERICAKVSEEVGNELEDEDDINNYHDQGDIELCEDNDDNCFEKTTKDNPIEEENPNFNEEKKKKNKVTFKEPGES